jgi:hypothetical protein
LLNYLFVEAERVLDLGHVFEMSRVRNSEALHTVSMAPLLKVLLKGPTAPVGSAAADLALILLPEPMQFE